MISHTALLHYRRAKVDIDGHPVEQSEQEPANA